MALWQAWAERLQHWQWIGMLLARLAVGLLFMLSGGGKLFSPPRREQMRGVACGPDSQTKDRRFPCLPGGVRLRSLARGRLPYPDLLFHAHRCHAGSALDHDRARNQGAIRS